MRPVLVLLLLAVAPAARSQSPALLCLPEVIVGISERNGEYQQANYNTNKDRFVVSRVDGNWRVVNSRHGNALFDKCVIALDQMPGLCEAGGGYWAGFFMRELGNGFTASWFTGEERGGKTEMTQYLARGRCVPV